MISNKTVIPRNRACSLYKQPRLGSHAPYLLSEEYTLTTFPDKRKLFAELISCTFVKARALDIMGSFMKMEEVIGTAFEIMSPSLLLAPISPLISVGRAMEDVYICLFLEFHSLLQEWAIREN